MIPTNPLGRTGLSLTRIGFGSAPIGDLRRAPSDAETHELLQRAWDAGIRYFDTAPMYGSGLAERRLGDFLRDKPRDDYVLSTKVGRVLVPDRAWAVEQAGGDPRALPFRHAFDFSYDAVMRTYGESLQRLGLDRIDILYLHDIGRFVHRDRHEEMMTIALNGGVRALRALRESGAVRAIGAGVNEWQVLDELMNHGQWDVFLLANRYTLLDQDVLNGFLQRCLREGVAIVDGAPLNAGILATGGIKGAQYNYRLASEAILDRVRRIEALCLKHGVPLICAGLNFPLGHEAVVSIIPGFAQPDEVTGNLAHFREAIPSELWDDLKRDGLLHPDAPPPATPVLA